jgi:hypothetical protein
MSSADNSRDHALGERTASRMLGYMQRNADNALDEAQFWSGYISAVSGWAAGSIGPEALASVLRVIADDLPMLTHASEEEEAH